MAPHVAVVHSILFMLTTRRSIPGMVAVAFALTASSRVKFERKTPVARIGARGQ